MSPFKMFLFNLVTPSEKRSKRRFTGSKIDNSWEIWVVRKTKGLKTRTRKTKSRKTKTLYFEFSQQSPGPFKKGLTVACEATVSHEKKGPSRASIAWYRESWLQVLSLMEDLSSKTVTRGERNRGVNLPSLYFLSQFPLLPTFWANYSLLSTFLGHFSLLPILFLPPITTMHPFHFTCMFMVTTKEETAQPNWMNFRSQINIIFHPAQ